jgi:hypothetical protein
MRRGRGIWRPAVVLPSRWSRHPPQTSRSALDGRKENDLDIAVLNTGHGALDHSAGTLVIDASRVNPAAVDSSTRRAIVGPGTCWADVSAASVPLGLTGLSGASPSA